ncbi:MAG: SAM-dependent methyltransferase [Opitutales bacterium]|jgi:SAM-dependent MidA family methyltransferase
MNALLDLLASKGATSFADFMRAALYAPGLGYYAKDRRRVGTRRDADFYTAESLGPVFAKLVCGAAWAIAAGSGGAEPLFVEMGAEPLSSVAASACPPFSKAIALERGGEIPQDGSVILFSNELFDAQPFHRVARLGGRWRECGVRIEGGRAVEVLLDALSEPVAAFAGRLPVEASEGYRMDLPLEAEALMASIAAKENVVAVIAFDYGLDWADILYRRPSGTARAYRRHELCPDLLADPGEQDLTCHICWDGLENALRGAGFTDVRTMRQEAFFMRHAMPQMEEVLRRGDVVECGKLRELIHPSRMGAAFQVLLALRRAV